MADRNPSGVARKPGARILGPARGLVLVLASLCGLTLLVTLDPPSSAQVRGRAREADNPQLFRHIEYFLERSYLDLDRIQPRPLMKKALSALELAADEIFVEDSDPEAAQVPVHVAGKVRVFDLGALDTRDEMVDLLERIFRFLSDNYQGSTELNELRYAAANGYLSGIDPHTLVFTPTDFEEFEVHIRGQIYGVGMLVGQNEEGKLEVKQVLEGTPAYQAGFKEGDLIAKIDDESTINMTVMEAVQKIRGPKDTEVVLTVKRISAKNKDEVETLTIPVKRDLVKIESVKSKILTSLEGGGTEPVSTGLGYVKVRTFDQHTADFLRSHLAEKLPQANGGKPLKGLILDLRDNSGGLLTQAIEMCDTFLRSGNIVATARKNERPSYDRAELDGNEPDFPLVVLANQGSASGSEIVIGALQKNNRALVLGTRTFGKGSVQQLHPLEQRGAQLKITVSEYLIPGEISIQETGVVPDVLAQPVVLEEDYHDLFPDERTWTEKDYEAHLISRYQREEEPAYRLQYLASSGEGEDGEEDMSDAERFMRGDLRPENDRLVRIGMKLLEYAQGESRDLSPREVLQTRRAEIESLGEECYGEIVRRLEDLGVDWTLPPGVPAVPGSPRVDAHLSWEITREPSKDKEDPVPVNQLVVTARVANRGSTPLYRIKGLSRSDYSPFREREFLFGKLEPGAQREIKEKFRLPYFPQAQNSLFTLELSGPDGQVFAIPSVEVVLPETLRPAFAYSARMEDESGKTLSTLAPESRVSMALRIRNVGQGPAHKGVAILRNKTGREIFLEKGRVEFSDLAPGAEVEVPERFQFRVRYGKLVETYDFELVVLDSYSGESLTRTLQIRRRGGAGGQEFENDRLFRAPGIELAVLDGKAEAPGGVLATDSSSVTLKARIEAHAASFRTWITHLPLTPRHRLPDKVYFADSQGKPELGYSTRVRLSDGLNLVTVVAKDAEGLESRRSWVVRHYPAATVKRSP